MIEDIKKIFILKTRSFYIMSNEFAIKKTKYSTVQIPQDYISLTKKIIPGYYRSHHEAFTDWIRKGIFNLIKIQYKLKKLNINVKDNEKPK